MPYWWLSDISTVAKYIYLLPQIIGNERLSFSIMLTLCPCVVWPIPHNAYLLVDRFYWNLA